MSNGEKRQRILVVDDERFNINVLADLLKPNYKVMAAINGKQALKAAGSANPPDLILLDIMMPEMDGYEVCRRLKADERTRDIPVIFVTAMGQDEDEAKGLSVGAADYLTKPISPSIVEARVRTQLALRQNLKDLQEANALIEAQRARMQDDLDVGHQIQMGMLTKDFPVRGTCEIHADLVPAREVGGDFYDVFEIDPRHLCLCVGDVSGKGVGAALFMAMAKTLIKSRAKNDPSPASIVTHVNAELEQDNESCMFVTLWLGILDTSTGRIQFANAGHNLPYVCRADGTVHPCEALHGPVAGAVEGLVYGESTLVLEPGDHLLLYTDGVTESISPSDELYTDARLVKLLGDHEIESAAALVSRTLDDVWRHQGDADQADDVTVLGLCYRGAPGGVQAACLEVLLVGALEEIDRCSQEFDQFSKAHGLSDAVRRTVRLVLDDLLNNVISYGYDDDPSNHEILVRFGLDSVELTIEIEDDGRPFNPFSQLQPDTTLGIDERAIGGLGIHLIREMMDDTSYTRRTNCNVVMLKKKRDAS